MGWLGLQKRGIRLVCLGELILLKQLVSGGAGGCGAGGQGLWFCM